MDDVRRDCQSTHFDRGHTNGKCIQAFNLKGLSLASSILVPATLVINNQLKKWGALLYNTWRYFIVILTNDELKSDILRVYDFLGKTPTTRQYAKLGKYSTATYKKRYGSWNNAILSFLGEKLVNIRKKRNVSSIENCPKCGTQFESVVKCRDKNGKQCIYTRKFCSSRCANSHVISIEQKIKTSHTNKKLFSEGKLFIPQRWGQVGSNGKIASKWEMRTCKVCGKEFDAYKNSPTRHCSIKCGTKNGGGYRPGSGRSKSGYYKGIYCGSTYELAWAIYRLDHNLPVNRFTTAICCKITGRKYFPDFVDDNTIYEIKGYERDDSVAIKTKIAEQAGFVVKVLRKQDLQKEFEWVKTQYKTHKFEILYDTYKPKFEYVCKWCSKHFSKDKKNKNIIVFCSRSCAGKYMTSKNTKKLEP